MNTYLVMAAVLSVLVGLVHSVLGEVLIFSKLRQGSVVPTLSAAPLQSRNVRILWATWHLASVLGVATATVLLHASRLVSPDAFVIHTMAIAMLLSSVLVLYATRARHPGWIGLAGVAVLCWLAL